MRKSTFTSLSSFKVTDTFVSPLAMMSLTMSIRINCSPTAWLFSVAMIKSISLFVSFNLRKLPAKLYRLISTILSKYVSINSDSCNILFTVIRSGRVVSLSYAFNIFCADFSPSPFTVFKEPFSQASFKVVRSVTPSSCILSLIVCHLILVVLIKELILEELLAVVLLKQSNDQFRQILQLHL